MSRNQVPSSSSRYQISSPQPYQPPDAANGSSPYPSFPRQTPQQPPQSRVASSSSANGPAPTTSPARPARSRMRDQPPPPPISTSQRDLRPIQTNLRRPSAASSTGGNDMSLSPISPAGPAANGVPGMFSDPFAADRSQRTELRAQANAAVQQTNMPYAGGASGPATNKLRNVVGAFISAGKKEEPIRRPGKSKARTAQKEEVWNISEGGKFAEIDSVLGSIRKDWPFVLESDFSASTLALSLLSQSASSSLPQHPSLSTFLKIHDALSSALQASVQAHFQSFAASLPAHATFLSTLGRAQQQIKVSKETLREARDGFAGKGKTELAGVRARERQVRDMLKILDTIDNLKQVPDRLENLIGEKRFLQAAVLLIRSLKIINKPEIVDIGAVTDLRSYFLAQENTLTDILVEELHNHLYLKTFNSDSRWQAYAPGQMTLPIIDPETELAEGHNGENGEPGPSSRLSRYLTALVSKPHEDQISDILDADLPAVVDNTRRISTGVPHSTSTNSLSSMATGIASPDVSNPEANSYRFIEVILESLGILGRLGSALDTVTQRVTSEVHTLIETTLDEVEERAERAEESEILLDGARNDTSRSIFAPSETINIAVALEAVGPPRHATVLRDLLWTLYSKLSAVLEGHRVVYEVSRWISTRRDFRQSSSASQGTFNVPVLEFWRPIQQEVSTLLQNYLTDDAQGSALDQYNVMSINEVLRDGKIARDRQKSMFRFNDTDSRAVSNEIKPIDESIHQTLKSSVPGLVNMQVADGAQTLDENLSAGGRHRNLVPPNAFNVTILFQPTISFIDRVSSIVPSGFEDAPTAFGGVLEEFVVKVFLPQLDERVTASFQNAVSGYDAYQVEPQAFDVVEKPPLRSSVRVMSLIHSLCFMLQTTPFHRENYSRLIVGVIVQYYQQCSTRFKDLVSGSSSIGSPEAPLALPAIWAQREDVIACLTDVRAVAPADREEILLTGHKEIKLELEVLLDKSVVESQLINSKRKIEALSHLSQSLRWFIDALLDLQDSAEETAPSDGVDVPEPTTSVTPLRSDPGDLARLPLTRAMAQRYEAIIQTYEQLVEMVLNTIRLEIRCRVMCNLRASLRKGDFRLESEALEPDSDIMNLAVHLTENDSVIRNALTESDESFIFRGLGQLVDHLFINSARHITVINKAGVQKIQRNILALQQTLRAIQDADEGVLARSMQYWDLYEQGPKNMLETLRNGKPAFSFDDYNTMLNLQCKSEQSEAPSSELNTYLIDLHALSMSIEGWEIGEG